MSSSIPSYQVHYLREAFRANKIGYDAYATLMRSEPDTVRAALNSLEEPEFEISLPIPHHLKACLRDAYHDNKITGETYASLEQAGADAVRAALRRLDEGKTAVPEREVRRKHKENDRPASKCRSAEDRNIKNSEAEEYEHLRKRTVGNRDQVVNDFLASRISVADYNRCMSGATAKLEALTNRDDTRSSSSRVKVNDDNLCEWGESLNDTDEDSGFSEGTSSTSNNISEQNGPEWLLLSNSGTDCFLNAALQFMRRARDLGSALVTRGEPEQSGMNERQKMKEDARILLKTYLTTPKAKYSPHLFRNMLAKVLGNRLEPTFLHAQQDASEVLGHIFDVLVPNNVEQMFHIESARRRRCRDYSNCKILDLELNLARNWKGVGGETELRHCSECCRCCIANEKGHNEDKCKQCKADRRHYVEEQCYRFKGSSKYVMVAFNIMNPDSRFDWALSGNCNLDRMKLMGHHWKAVSVIKHSGHVSKGDSSGHYVTYTRENDGHWWLHDDGNMPVSIGKEYRGRSGYKYPPGTTDMEGVVALLFEKI